MSAAVADAGRPDAWIALDAAADPRRRARSLAHARERVLSGGLPPAGLRATIVRSWQRCQRAGLDADRALAPIGIASDEAGERWVAHPLAATLPAIRAILSAAWRDAGQVALICDRDGTLLWLEGAPAVLEAARAVRLQRGSVWSERCAGTNAMGTALVEEHPLQVFSAEHFSGPLDTWVCSAAPIRDPVSGAVLGVVDLSGGVRTAHPHTLGIVRAAAGAAETELRRRADRGDRPSPRRAGSRSSASRPALRLRVLGRDRVEVRGRRTLALSPRHGELLVLLMLRPEGWSAEQLAIELLGDFGRPVTVRAELSRLRRLLEGRIGSQPYRLLGRVQSDRGEVESALERDDVAAALDLCRGALLPSSEVPTLVEERRRLELLVATAVHRSGDPDLLARWLSLPSGRDDERACRLLLERAVDGTPGHALAISRLARLTRTRNLDNHPNDRQGMPHE